MDQENRHHQISGYYKLDVRVCQGSEEGLLA